MKFKLRDFALINNAEIDIDKINVVCGYNSMGKSTISKVLYCIFKSVCENKQYFALVSIHNRLRLLINKINGNNINIRNMDFFELIEVYENEKDQYFKGETNKRIDDNIKSMDHELDIINKDNHSLSLSIIKNLLTTEFHTRQFSGKFSLNDPFFSICADFDKSDDIEISGFSNIWDVFYLESFSLFDLNSKVSFMKKYSARSDYLNKMLQVENNLVGDGENRVISNFEDKLEKLIKGKFTFKGGRFFYNSFDMENTSSGIKQIGLIQLLLSNRNLRKNTFLIIDNPETDLHPDLQVKFAEILVLMVRELNITLYINSHSPHFVEAIEVYSTKYGLKDNTRFYLTQTNDDETCTLEQINFKNLYRLYNNLGDPYDIVDAVRGENLARDL